MGKWIDWQVEWAQLREGFWPPGCRICSADLVDEVGCKDHALGTLIRPDGVARCGLCSRRLPSGIAADDLVAPPWLPSGVGNRSASWRRCRSCRLGAPGFGRLLALGDYPGQLRPWILGLKHGRRQLAGVLARLLAERMDQAGWLTQRATLVPVPAHWLRRLERGADGPYALAKALGRELGWSLEPALRRRRYTTPQGEPGSSSRQANVRDGFTALGSSPAFKGTRPLILVDDVVSSGATLAACVQTLRAVGGTHSVGAVCLARALKAK